MRSLAMLESNDPAAKMEIASMTRYLMPQGVPQFEAIRYCAPIQLLVQEHSYNSLLKIAWLMVKDFCNCVNVVRNMNEDQMVEAAQMLVDECGDFRLEDYQVMFTLAKRGQLVKIMDRVDIPLIGTMLEAYYSMRRIAGQRLQEEEFRKKDNEYNDRRIPKAETEDEKTLEQNFGKLVGVMTAWKQNDDAAEEFKAQEKRKKQVEAYATLHNVDLNEVVKQFPPTRKKENNG